MVNLALTVPTHPMDMGYITAGIRVSKSLDTHTQPQPKYTTLCQAASNGRTTPNINTMTTTQKHEEHTNVNLHISTAVI